MNHFVRFAVLVLLIAGCENGYDKNPQQKVRSEPLRSVIHVGTSEITYETIEEYLQFRPITSVTAGSDSLSSRLDELVTTELLYQDAVSNGIESRPNIQRQIRQLVVQTYLSEQVEAQVQQKEFATSELEHYYRENQSKFGTSRQVRLADIFFDTRLKNSESDKETVKAYAHDVLEQALEIQSQRMGFGSLISKHSAATGRYPVGDTGYFDEMGHPFELPQPLVEAAFNLNKIGAIHPHLIETEDGFHIIMLVGKRPAFKKSFEQVQNFIEQKLREDLRDSLKAQLIANLRTATEVTFDEALLAELKNSLALPVTAESQPKTFGPVTVQ